MQQLDFISSESLIASVQEDLSSFDANNQLDPGRWYSWIQKVVSDLGVACYEYKHELIWIKNHQGIMPCDFKILDSAFMVNDSPDGGCYPDEGPLHYQGRSIIWDDTTTACAQQMGDCNGDCNYRTCTLETFNEITVREYVRGLPYTYTASLLYPLYVNQRVSKGWCLSNSICFGAKSNHEVTINNGTMFTNFNKGLVLINYYAYPYDDNGLPKIPNDPKFKLAVEHYLKWKILETLWINNDDMGVLQKMQYYKNEFEQNSYPDAEYYVKLASMSTMMDMTRNARKRLNVYQLLQK